jgi:hypothetical protein
MHPLVASLPFGSVLADAPKSKNAKVTLVYQPRRFPTLVASRKQEGEVTGTWLICPFVARFEFPAGSRYEWLAGNYLIA